MRAPNILCPPWPRGESIEPQGRIEGLQQGSIAEGLEQTRHSAIRGDEDDRNVMTAKLQFALKVRSGHTRHADVEDQTVGLPDVFGAKELFRRRERSRGETELPQQVG